MTSRTSGAGGGGNRHLTDWPRSRPCARLCMDAPLLTADFKEFLRLLNANRVDYLLVGAFAVGLHGYPRATVDLDIWVRPAADNALCVIEALKQFGFDVPAIEPRLFIDPRSRGPSQGPQRPRESAVTMSFAPGPALPPSSTTVADRFSLLNGAANPAKLRAIFRGFHSRSSPSSFFPLRRRLRWDIPSGCSAIGCSAFREAP